MLEHLTSASFNAQLNTKFRLSPEPEKTIEIELVEVKESGDVEGQEERFSAFFRGPLEFFLPQRTYALEHEQLGSFDLFIVPIRKDDEGFYYEAVFNRLK
jgi:hypothetical protein